MHDYDIELRQGSHRKGSDETSDRAPADAGRAIRAGRADTLSAGSVMHLQQAAGNNAVAQLIAAADERTEDGSAVQDVVGKGGGRPLDAGIRGAMESSFGADFGDVRVHTDAAAADSAAAVRAQAYTVGSDIVVGRGGLDASSPVGQRMLAHELTHVVQQRSGPVDGTPVSGGISLSSPGDRFERAAEANAERVATGLATGQQAEDQEEEASGQPMVQREELPEEEMEQG